MIFVNLFGNICVTITWQVVWRSENMRLIVALPIIIFVTLTELPCLSASSALICKMLLTLTLLWFMRVWVCEACKEKRLGLFANLVVLTEIPTNQLRTPNTRYCTSHSWQMWGLEKFSIEIPLKIAIFLDEERRAWKQYLQFCFCQNIPKFFTCSYMIMGIIF